MKWYRLKDAHPTCGFGENCACDGGRELVMYDLDYGVFAGIATFKKCRLKGIYTPSFDENINFEVRESVESLWWSYVSDITPPRDAIKTPEA